MTDTTEVNEVNEVNEPGMTDPPQPAERGRYALYDTPAGPVIGRATGLCDTCANCGCGDQQEPIDLTPAGVMRLIRERGITLPSPREMLKMFGGTRG